MRRTLLELTQDILSALDSDEVSSISDTVESYQVANLIRSCYYEIAVEMALPEHESMFELTASGDNTKPCIMYIPTNVIRLDWVRYENKLTGETTSHMVEVRYLPFDEFVQRQNGLSLEDTLVGDMVVSSNGESFTFKYYKDRFPQFFTTFDDNTLIFDSFNEDEDTTLQKIKTQCYGSVYNTFVMTDNAYPSMPAQLFPYLFNKAKTRAFMELKQLPNPEAAQEARNQKIVSQKRKLRTTGDAAINRLTTRQFGRK